MGGILDKSSTVDYCEIVESDKSISNDSVDSFMPNMNKIIDPRSPTFGIARTPIQLALEDKNYEENILDPRSPSHGIARTPIVPDGKCDRNESVEATFGDSSISTLSISDISINRQQDSIISSSDAENMVENISDLRLNQIKMSGKYSPRSPLSDRNTNSLSTFVLRKQAIKAAIAMKQPYAPIDYSDDKENCTK